MKIIKKITRKILNNAARAKYKSIQAFYTIFGSRVECNICHYKSRMLNSDSWHKFTVCPNCGSGVRSRLLWAAFCYTEEGSIDKIIKNKNVLHFAPEKNISELVELVAGNYKTADFFAEGYLNAYTHIDFNMDISDMHQLKDGEYNCVIACDVLEHVYDDKKAVEEVYRVLDKGGYCIFTVPQKDKLEKTYEDPTIISPQEREEKFGQFDHLRIYGNNFVQMLKNAGFNTVEIDENNFNKKLQIKNVLYPPVLSTRPLATNYRKIFIGHKV